MSHKFGFRLVLDHSHANLNHHRRKFDTRIFSEIDNYSRSSIVVFILRSKLVNLVRLRFLAFLRSYGYWEKWKTIRAIITDFEDQKATLPQTKKVESLISELLTHKRVVRVSCYFPDFSYYNSLPKTLQSLNLKSTSTNFQEILKVKNGIGIHVRLGDLLQISLAYPGTEVPILTESYFISCLTASVIFTRYLSIVYVRGIFTKSNGSIPKCFIFLLIIKLIALRLDSVFFMN